VDEEKVKLPEEEGEDLGWSHETHPAGHLLALEETEEEAEAAAEEAARELKCPAAPNWHPVQNGSLHEFAAATAEARDEG